MRNILFALLILAACIQAFPQESREARRCRRGQAAGYATRDATVMSMMGWGIGIAIGIATLCALIDNETGSGSSGGGGGTTH